MSRKSGRHGGGGRTGQHHRKTPTLGSYSVPPASEVTITRPDGTVEIEPAKTPKAERTRRTPSRRTLIQQQDKRNAKPPVPIQKVRPTKQDATRAEAKAQDAVTLAARGLRAISAAQAVSRTGGKPAVKAATPPPAGEQRPAGRGRARAPQKAQKPLPRPPSKTASRKQILSVDCPTCQAPTGTACTMPQGHRTRLEVFFASVGK